MPNSSTATIDNSLSDTDCGTRLLIFEGSSFKGRASQFVSTTIDDKTEKEIAGNRVKQIALGPGLTVETVKPK